jgi:hypothetical protein
VWHALVTHPMVKCMLNLGVDKKIDVKAMNLKKN